ERDVKMARDKARAANDFLAREIEKRRDRYSGFAHLAVQDAAAAADELERCMRELKFCGAMINGHTNGMYLDDRSLDPFWERAQALDALIYLHPADPLTPAPCWTATTGCGGRRGNGPSRPAHTPCASCSEACSIASRAPGSRSGTWGKPCRSCSGASTAARDRIFMPSSSRSVPRNTSRTTSWWRPRAWARRNRSTARSVHSGTTV